MLLSLLLSTASLARELKNDGCVCDGSDETVTFQQGFVDGECWASTYHPDAADYPFTPGWVNFLIGPSGEGYFFDVFLYQVNASGQPTTQLMGDAASVNGSSQNLSQVDLLDFKQDIPEITNGDLAVVVCFDGHSSTPTIANDADGLDYPDRNWIYTNSRWYKSGDLGVTGDWIMRLGWGNEGDADTDADADSDADSDADTDTDAAIELYSITPAATKDGTSVDLTILGQGFQDGATAHIGGLSLTGAQVRDDGTLTGRSPSALPSGTHDVDVVNPDGSSAYLAAAFTVDGGCGCGTGSAPGWWGFAAGAAVLLSRRPRAPRG